MEAESDVDIWNRMSRLGMELAKLSPRASTAPRVVHSLAHPSPPQSGCELLPLLERLIIRFPDASREGRGKSFKLFRETQRRFLGAIKKFVASAHIKSFQLEDFRDFKRVEITTAPSAEQAARAYLDEMSAGLMDAGQPRFGKLTPYFNKYFGVKCEDTTEAYSQDEDGRGEGWEIYYAVETWTAPGKYLIWRD